MATYTDLLVGDSGGSQVAGRVGVLKQTVVLDLAADAEDRGNPLINDGGGIDETDVVQLFQVPANCIVERVMYEIEEASDTIADFDVGDGTVDGWVGAADATSTGYGLAGGAHASANTLGKLYTTADTIDFSVDTAGTHTTGRIRFTALFVPNVA
jgi:hypothetical protein